MPREVLNEAKRKANGLATKNDAAELSLTNATLAREVDRPPFSVPATMRV